MNIEIIKPYLQLSRLDRPIGTFLLLWPTLCGLWVAGQGQPNPAIVLIFIIGTIIMRAAGCIINDYADRNFDPHVNRTANRPLATGAVPIVAALCVFFVLIGIAFVLVLQLNIKTIVIATFALVFAISYPFAKRVTHFPQVLLGIAFSSAVLMAFTAISNSLPLIAWLLFFANLCWTVAYDTEYAMADREDDLRIGIKSTAILFAEKDTLYIVILQVVTLLLLALFGYAAQLNSYFYLSLAFVGLLFIHQYVLIHNRDAERCHRAFLNNNWVGALIFSGTLLGLIKI